MPNENFVQVGPVELPLTWNNTLKNCILRYFNFNGQRYLVVEIGAIDPKSPEQTLVRIQSACVFGDLFESSWCDCNWQLKEAKRLLFEADRGLLIHGYDQNGKGLTLENHYRVYADGQAKDLELLTEAFDYLGYKYENRHYDDVGFILKNYYNITSIRLMTNDPVRIDFFSSIGIHVDRIAIQAPINELNETELRIKKEKFGHLIKM